MSNQPKTAIRVVYLWAVLFGYGLEELRRAYEASREASDRARVRLEQQWEELEQEVAAGRANFIEEDDEGRVAYDRGEHAGEMMAEISGVLRILREAFTISLYHFWEREVASRMKAAAYSDAKAFAFLKSLGTKPNEAALTTLRLAANVAKHGKGDSAKKLHALRPDLFDTKAMARSNDSAGYEYLRITDAILEEFFDAVRDSGPQRKVLSRKI